MDSDDDDRFQVNPQFHRDLEEEDEEHHNKSYTPDESSSCTSLPSKPRMSPKPI